MNNWHLNGKVAVVTGGTKGIGRAILSEFLSLGAEVLFVARNKQELTATITAFTKPGIHIYGLKSDVQNRSDREEIVNWVEKKWGKLDILVNNAGLNIRKPSNDYQPEEYTKIVDVNLIAPFEMCRLLYPHLVRSGRASIINIASIAGVMEARTGAPYAMAKAGLIQMSKNLAAEWATSKIRVNAVSPWFTRTPATAPVLADKEVEQRIIDRTPLGRVATAEDISGAAAFLAMDKASYITGQHFLIDGGATSHIL